MIDVPNNIKSVVDLVKACYSQIVGQQHTSLTSIQSQQAEARFRQQLSADGITYGWSGSEDGIEGLRCHFESMYIQDSGIISDVYPVGHHPIHLSVGENVSVVFEPRDITQVEDWRVATLSNARFAPLKKGSSFAFGGRLVWCEYRFNKPGGPFVFWVDSEFRPPMSVVDWLLKLWDGRLPGIEFVD